MNRTINQLKAAWDENPLAVITTAALAVTATAKIVDAASAAQGRRAYAKQVNLRAKKSTSK